MTSWDRAGLSVNWGDISKRLTRACSSRRPCFIRVQLDLRTITHIETHCTHTSTNGGLRPYVQTTKPGGAFPPLTMPEITQWTSFRKVRECVTMAPRDEDYGQGYENYEALTTRHGTNYWTKSK